MCKQMRTTGRRSVSSSLLVSPDCEIVRDCNLRIAVSLVREICNKMTLTIFSSPLHVHIITGVTFFARFRPSAR